MSHVSTTSVKAWRLFKSITGACLDSQKVPEVHLMKRTQKSFIGYAYAKPLHGNADVENESGPVLERIINSYAGAYVRKLRPWHFGESYIMAVKINKLENLEEPKNIKLFHEQLIAGDLPTIQDTLQRDITLIKYIGNCHIIGRPYDELELMNKKRIPPNDPLKGIGAAALKALIQSFKGKKYLEEMCAILKKPKRYNLEDFSQHDLDMKIYYSTLRIENYQLPNIVPAKCLLYGDTVLPFREQEDHAQNSESSPSDIAPAESLVVEAVDAVPVENSILLENDDGQIYARIEETNDEVQRRRLVETIIGCSLPDEVVIDVHLPESPDEPPRKKSRAEKILEMESLTENDYILVKLSGYPLLPGKLGKCDVFDKYEVFTFECDNGFYYEKVKGVSPSAIFHYSKEQMWESYNKFFDKDNPKKSSSSRKNYVKQIITAFDELMRTGKVTDSDC